MILFSFKRIDYSKQYSRKCTKDKQVKINYWSLILKYSQNIQAEHSNLTKAYTT